MVRENLINDVVSFLQDPSVASAPIEKKIEYLHSKNLTQEEIDISLARAGQHPSSAGAATPASSVPASYQYRQAPPPPPPGYAPYPGYWQQPPPEPPRRDWRDWFIMATVLGGVGYGLYFTAKRYIMPIVAPPTPPQLEQDKASIDAEFERAFALLDQLNTDTTALKASEEERTKKLDTALAELEGVLTSLRESDKRRGDDARRMDDEVRGLRDLIPKALEAHKETQDSRLKELSGELKSLKTLVGNRMGGNTSTASPAGRPLGGAMGGGTWGAPSPATPVANGASSSATASPAVTSNPPPSTEATPANGASSSTAPAPERVQTSSPYGRMAGGRAAIPAWQLPAKKAETPNGTEEKKDTSESGTVTETSVGA